MVTYVVGSRDVFLTRATKSARSERELCPESTFGGLVKNTHSYRGLKTVYRNDFRFVLLMFETGTSI